MVLKDGWVERTEMQGEKRQIEMKGSEMQGEKTYLEQIFHHYL